jgi:hypothetical protein
MLVSNGRYQMLTCVLNSAVRPTKLLSVVAARIRALRSPGVCLQRASECDAWACPHPLYHKSRVLGDLTIRRS